MRSLAYCITALVLVATPSSARAQARDPMEILVGRWTLHDAKGGVAGDSVVEVLRPGAMLFERRRVGDAPPQPLWFAHFETGGWQQLFVGPRATLRTFTTESAPGRWPVVMGATIATQDGQVTRYRMTMSRATDDEIRRLLEASTNGGLAWATVFDYTYRRVP